MKIIGLHAKARSGKDEVAKILCKMYGFKQISFADFVKELTIKYFDQTHEQVYEKKNKESRLLLQGVGQSIRENLTSLYAAYNTDESPDMVSIDPINGFPRWVNQIAMKDFELPPAYLGGKRKKTKIVLNGVQNMFMDNLEDFYTTANGKGEDFFINHLFNSCTEDITYILSDVRYLNEKEAVENNKGYVIKITRTDKAFIEHGDMHPSEIELDLETGWFYHISNEHKTDWKEFLVMQSTNMIRKLDSVEFFSDEDKKKFKINISEHE